MKTNININENYLPAIGKVFTPIVMDSLASDGRSDFLSEVCIKSGLISHIDPTMCLSQFLDWIYNILFKNYRNEYIYKNVIANRILLGRHNLNTSHMLTEFRAGCCKADVVIINGTSTVYEIKSEFDSFARLENQINSYFEVFDHINVITSPRQAGKLTEILPQQTGILVLTDRNSISTKRKSVSNKENINQKTLFDSLRKNEYLKAINEYYGEVPDVPNTLIFRECKKLFSKIPPADAHDLTIKILKNRGNSQILKEFVERAPASLSAYAMTISSDKKKMQSLMPRFEKSIQAVLAT